MSDMLLGLMIPLGRRWKSYSLPSTTTVCPALLPPCKSKWGTHYEYVVLSVSHTTCFYPGPPGPIQPHTHVLSYIGETVMSLPLPNSPSFSSTYFNRLGWPYGSSALRPGLLTYQATLRMWPRSSPVGGALKPPEHRVPVLSVQS